MPTLQARTALANGAQQTVVTDGYINIVLNVFDGNASCECIIDGAQTDGYRFRQPTGAVVIAAAHSLIVTGIGQDGCEFEVYAP